MTKPRSLSVSLGERSYDILIGTTVLAQAGKLMRPLLKSDRVIIITDANLAERHLARLQRALDDAGIRHEHIVIPPGDGSKTLDQLGRLIRRLLDLKVERSTTLLALGGGVIGDLAGFAAASAGPEIALGRRREKMAAMAFSVPMDASVISGFWVDLARRMSKGFW